MPTKILNQTQAEAVYSAMCALNQVHGDLAADMLCPNDSLISVRMDCYDIRIRTGRREEKYKNTATFATAYGLQQG